MRDALYEESASSANSSSEVKKYTVIRIFSIVFFVLAALHAMLSFTLVPAMIAENTGGGLAFLLVQWFSFLVMFLGLGILLSRMKLRYNVSYDYIFVEDELRVSKVFNGKKRKFLLTMKKDGILKVGLCERDSFERTLSGETKKPTFLTPNDTPREGKMMIYIVYSDSVGKTVYVLECREQLLEHIVATVGRNKLELQ